MTTGNPFAALGLPARADLSDDDVRAGWRRLAAATHPDRADGGDPARFAAAAAAYTALRTRSGRGEALADLTAPTPPPGRTHPPGRAAPIAEPRPASAAAAARPVAARIRHGRPLRRRARVAIAALLSAGVAIVAGTQPATPALIVGIVTWLLLTGRHDLAPPR
jgi:curved DNA-binding protein CbpA